MIIVYKSYTERNIKKICWHATITLPDLSYNNTERENINMSDNEDFEKNLNQLNIERLAARKLSILNVVTFN